jgi:hypothetical protein
MKNKIIAYDFRRTKNKKGQAIVVFLKNKIPAPGYSAKQIAKMFKDYHKKHQK